MHRRLRLLAGLAACLCIVSLPLGGGAQGATSAGADGDVVFVRTNSGTSTIQRLAGGSLTLLATGYIDPSWSPDGTQLAIVNATTGAIGTCAPAGCNSPTAFGAATGSTPVWSPAGTKIAYVSGGNIHTGVVPGDTSDTTLTAGTHPSWSPDGTKIVFSNGGSIFTCTVASCAGSISGALASGTQPAWSPDGLTIAYQSGGNVFVVPASGGTANLVAPGTSPSWSPTTDSIALVNGNSQIAESQGSGSVWQNPAIAVTAGANVSGQADSSPDWQTVVPVRGTAPSIFGTAQTGQQLSSTNGSWTGASATGYSYQWRRCDSAGNNCSDIGSATASTYSVVGADVGNRLRVVVTASNAAGSTASNPSNATAVVTQAGVVTPPSNSAYPEISFGSDATAPLVGAFISTTAGTWSGSFPMTFKYQWKWCDSPVSSCFDIIGATSSFYTVPVAYYGKVLRVQVTATNSAASVAQNSEATPAVSAIAPKLRVTPPIVGQNIVDQTLSVGLGSWDGAPAPTFKYSWRRCNPAGDLASCKEIPGGTSATYTAAVADIGFTIRAWVTGSNVAGSDLAVTNHTFPIVDKQHFSPSVTTAPAIAGTVALGRQLTASIGSFDGDLPIATTFVWQRCDAIGTACHTIPGATKVVYHPTESDLGATLRLTVTAKNGYGTLISRSDATDPVLGAPPHRKGRRLVGTPRGDYLAGGGFDDVILGRRGNDTLLGGMGDDRIDGGFGNDVITGGAGADVLVGGLGSDTIYAADGERDIVDCGKGNDRVVADSVDVVKNCELVQIGSTGGPGSGSGSGGSSGGSTSP